MQEWPLTHQHIQENTITGVSNATATDRAFAEAEHKELLVHFVVYKKVKKGLKNLIMEVFDEVYLEAL